MENEVKKRKVYINDFINAFLNLSEDSTILELEAFHKEIIKHEVILEAKIYVSMLKRVYQLKEKRRVFLNGKS